MSPSDLDWGRLGNYGTDREVAKYLGNHEGTCDCEGMQSHADVDAFKVFAKDNFLREREENSENL